MVRSCQVTKTALFAGKSSLHTTLHSCGKLVGETPLFGAVRSPPRVSLWTSRWTAAALAILAGRRPRTGGSSSLLRLDEAHLSAQRPPPQAQARLSRAHVDARRPRDPQAAPRQGAARASRRELRLRSAREAREPPVPLAGLRRRLPPRPLGLVALPRPLLVSARGATARRRAFGFSVPQAVGGAVERNRIKRQLREVWQARSARACPPATTTC